MNYAKYEKKAREKIKAYGSECEIKRKTTSYNADTNTYEDVEDINKGYALQSQFDIANINNTNIKFGDILLLCVFDRSPKPNETIKFGEKTYTIVNVQSLNPNGKTDIYYKVHAR